jgi:primosomal protein N' (replication factor Y)
MYVLDVIPIAKAVGRETLSYFTSERVAPGMLVSVPLRSRVVQAIVAKVEDVRTAKARLRSLDHELRSITGLEAAHFLLPFFVSAASRIAEMSATTTGSVISALVPKAILTSARELAGATAHHARGAKRRAREGERATTTATSPEVLLLQVPPDERLAVYRRLIREEFARGGSVMLIVPTIYLAERLKDALAKGIEQYTFLLHSARSSRRTLVALWRRALEEPHPICIISTYAGLSLPRSDITAYILEEENSEHYTLPARPFLDIRVAVEALARERGVRCILGATALRVEESYRLASGEAHALVPPTLRQLSAARSELIDMTAERDVAPQNARVRRARAILSDEARALVESAQGRGERVLVFAARRGLAPTTICGDCARAVTCRRCSGAVVLHSAPRRNVFRCHRCLDERDAHEVCSGCGGWKLVALGIGTEGVAEALHAVAPEALVTRVDSDATPTARAAQEAIETFLSSPRGILVATEMALPYLSADVEHVIVASLDSLLALPDFRMSERVFSLLLALRSRALHTFLLQTRMAGQSVFSHAIKGHVSAFAEEELAERKRFGYPPFTTLIKISHSGAREAVAKEMEKLTAQLAPYRPLIYPALREAVRGKNTMHALIKIPRERWPDPDLLCILRSLPPALTIAINPEHIA